MAMYRPPPSVVPGCVYTGQALCTCTPTDYVHATATTTPPPSFEARAVWGAVLQGLGFRFTPSPPPPRHTSASARSPGSRNCTAPQSHLGLCQGLVPWVLARGRALAQHGAEDGADARRGGHCRSRRGDAHAGKRRAHQACVRAYERVCAWAEGRRWPVACDGGRGLRGTLVLPDCQACAPVPRRGPLGARSASLAEPHGPAGRLGTRRADARARGRSELRLRLRMGGPHQREHTGREAGTTPPTQRSAGHRARSGGLVGRLQGPRVVPRRLLPAGVHAPQAACVPISRCLCAHELLVAELCGAVLALPAAAAFSSRQVLRLHLAFHPGHHPWSGGRKTGRMPYSSGICFRAVASIWEGTRTGTAHIIERGASAAASNRRQQKPERMPAHKPSACPHGRATAPGSAARKALHC